MESTFPFGLPAPTAFYLTLYVATFAIHQAFMHYVLAGSLYVAWTTFAPGPAELGRVEQPLASTLRDWMPFALSAAITAGVAPLLFIQIVYPRHFYTANLLLGWRWMMVIPILVGAFYLLYLVKSSAIVRWHYAARTTAVALVAASFLFVGFCWTANHLISSNAADWPQIYASRVLHLSLETVVLRMLVWIGGAFASMAVIAGWQLKGQESLNNHASLIVEGRRLAWLSLSGLAVAAASAIVLLIRSNETVQKLTLGVFALPYVIAAVTGVGLQALAWVWQLRVGYCRWLSLLATLSCGVTLIATSVVREALRLAVVDVNELYQRHSAAATIGGVGVFLTLAAVNTALIVGCIWLVRRSLRSQT